MQVNYIIKCGIKVHISGISALYIYATYSIHTYVCTSAKLSRVKFCWHILMFCFCATNSFVGRIECAELSLYFNGDYQ